MSTYDIETDVVVVGAGAAGFSAALTALSSGADVVLLEKAATLGGTTIKSSGWAWYPNHRRLRERGEDDRREDALRYMARLSKPESYDPGLPNLGLPEWRYDLLDAFYSHAAEAAEALEQNGVAAVDLPEFPDYYSFLPEDVVNHGRTLRPATREGEGASADEMIAQGAAAVEARGGRILVKHAVEHVIQDDSGAVVGVLVNAGGRVVRVGARGGVVFASGGFAQNKAMRADLLAAPILGSCAAPGCTGDLVRIAVDLGLPLRNMTHPWMTLMTLEKAIENDPAAKSLFHPPGDSMLWVNRYGERTVNEKSPYNETAQMLQRWDPRHAEYPDLYQVMVWDQPCQDIHSSERQANPIRPAGEDAPHVVSADTLEELAARVAEKFEQLAAHTGGVQVAPDFAEKLVASVALFNRDAAAGKDTRLGRGDTPIERAFNEMMSGPPRHETNPLMFPLADTGPYYATIIVPGALDTKGGPMIDREARIVDAAGEAVPGLYGAGNCVASAAGKSYWAAGATIGPCVTFGYLAGRHAAERAVRTAPVAAHA